MKQLVVDLMVCWVSETARAGKDAYVSVKNKVSGKEEKSILHGISVKNK